jgi:hypothetical protein
MKIFIENLITLCFVIFLNVMLFCYGRKNVNKIFLEEKYR